MTTSEKFGVQQKIGCIFKTKIKSEPSGKRHYQPFSVTASEELLNEALEAGIETITPSEKFDGTCCFIQQYKGKPWLWARHDRKPNKTADKKFKKFQATHRVKELHGEASNTKETFSWNLKTDFKEVPHEWIPAYDVELLDGVPQPDSNGHIPGWVPVELFSRQHCWHLTAVDLVAGCALILRPQIGSGDNEEILELSLVPLHDLVGKTLELIGTNINGNPYNLGSKQQPVHILVVHGSVLCTFQIAIEYNAIKGWFETNPHGKVEGLVWHCPGGKLYKLHRHHLGLQWPVKDLHLNSRPMVLSVDNTVFCMDDNQKNSTITLVRTFQQTRFKNVSEFNVAILDKVECSNTVDTVQK